jgi:hypothetical protein
LNFGGMSVVLCGMCRSPMHSTSTILSACSRACVCVCVCAPAAARVLESCRRAVVTRANAQRWGSLSCASDQVTAAARCTQVARRADL